MTKLNYTVWHQNHFKSWRALLQGAVGPGMRSGVVAFRENLEGATRWEVSQWCKADDCFQTSGRAQPPAHTTSLMALTLFLLTGKSWTNLDDIWKSCLGKCVGKTLKKKNTFLFVCLYMDLRDACASKMIWSSLWCAIWFMLSWMLLNEHLKGRHLFQFPKTLQLLSFFRLCNMYDYHTMLHFFFISWWVSSIYDVCQWVQTQMNWALNFRRRKQTHTSCICHKLMGKKFCKVEKIRIWIRKLNILLKIS